MIAIFTFKQAELVSSRSETLFHRCPFRFSNQLALQVEARDEAKRHLQSEDRRAAKKENYK
jgi:hypothetical protein